MKRNKNYVRKGFYTMLRVEQRKRVFILKPDECVE